MSVNVGLIATDRSAVIDQFTGSQFQVIFRDDPAVGASQFMLLCI